MSQTEHEPGCAGCPAVSTPFGHGWWQQWLWWSQVLVLCEPSPGQSQGTSPSPWRPPELSPPAVWPGLALCLLLGSKEQGHQESDLQANRNLEGAQISSGSPQSQAEEFPQNSLSDPRYSTAVVLGPDCMLGHQGGLKKKVMAGLHPNQ